jgi:hypothetical protein
VCFLEVSTSGGPGDLAITFVQDMEEHFRKDIQYCDLSVIVSRVDIDPRGRKIYSFYTAANYYSNEVDNYFTLPLRKFPPGTYLLRLFATEPSPS